MEKIQELVKKPLIMAVAGFVLGLIIGLPVLGWGIMPVRWTDADPSYLRADVQDDYFCMIAESYIKTGDAFTAKSRLEGLGEVSGTKLNSILPGDCGLTSSEIDQFKTALGAVSVPLPEGTTAAPAAPGMEQPTSVVPGQKEESKRSPFLWVGIFCGFTLLLGAVLAYLLFIRNKRDILPPSRTTYSSTPQREQEFTPITESEEFEQEPPIAQFMSTYVTGDDLYDDSFSIDSPSGEFLGECGVGISETIGVGEPKKVTAFEVWLFDKNDIQTVTKVLMSQHAWDDPAISQRLASKGEPVLIKPGGQVVLETATLVMEARVVDMNYGQGALPEASFLDRVTLELAIWPKN